MAMDNADFSGYATKAGLKCTDGRTITPEAFKHMDGVQVPLVWQHGHHSPENVLGHAVLEARDDGMYAYGFFNETPFGQQAKALVSHKDVKSLSIWANSLVEKLVSGTKQVLHGVIREVSLVLSGANPGALIDFIAIQHDDGTVDVSADEAIIYTGLEFEHAEGDGMTVREVYDSLTDDQKDLVHFMIGAALEAQGDNVAAQSATTGTESSTTTTASGTVIVNEQPPTTNTSPASPAQPTTEDALTHQEGTTIVTNNVFETGTKPEGEKHVLTHDAMKGIVAAAVKGGSLKAAVEDYALQHGIENLDILFPDAKAVTDRPEWNKRRTEWVAGVLNNTRKSPFSRVKSLVADLTLDEARAKGYVTGTLKKEEWFGLTRRTTTPTTVYKKQKLDRDDIVDIADFDVVAWMKGEMRIMLEEELARAILIGDGRAVDDEDKIKDPAGATDGAGIRSIANDDDLYSVTVNLNLGDASSSYMEFVDSMISSRRFYRGTGTPTMYTTESVIANLLILRDADGKRHFRNLEELAAEFRVAAVVPVEVLEDEPDILAIVVNLADYNVGADKGGEVSLFDDFDIDYNQFKYLIETRISGALVKIRSAIVYRSTDAASVLLTPAAPTQAADEVTIVDTANVTYKVGAFTGLVTYNAAPVTVGQTVTASFPIVLPDGASVTVVATPTNAATHHFATNVEDEWTFDYEA